MEMLNPHEDQQQLLNLDNEYDNGNPFNVTTGNTMGGVGEHFDALLVDEHDNHDDQMETVQLDYVNAVADDPIFARQENSKELPFLFLPDCDEQQNQQESWFDGGDDHANPEASVAMIQQSQHPIPCMDHPLSLQFTGEDNKSDDPLTAEYPIGYNLDPRPIGGSGSSVISTSYSSSQSTDPQNSGGTYSTQQHRRRRRGGGVATGSSQNSAPTSLVISETGGAGRVSKNSKQRRHPYQSQQQSTGLRASLDAGMMNLRRWVRSHISTTATNVTSPTANSPAAERTLSEQQQYPFNEDLLQLLSPNTNEATTATSVRQRSRFVGRSQRGPPPQQRQYDSATAINHEANHHVADLLTDDDVLHRHRALSEPDELHMRHYLSGSTVSNSAGNNMIRRRGQQPQLMPPSGEQHDNYSSDAFNSDQLRRRAFTTTCTTEFNRDNMAYSAIFQDDDLDGDAQCNPFDEDSNISTAGLLGYNNNFYQVMWNNVASTTPDMAEKDESVAMSEALGGAGLGRGLDDPGVITPLSANAALNTALPSPSGLSLRDSVNFDVTEGSSYQFPGSLESRRPGPANDQMTGSNNSSSNDVPIANNNNSAPVNGASHNNATTPEDPDRVARQRWIQINRRFQLVIAVVAIIFSLLLFAILIGWVVLTSAYAVSLEKECDIPLKPYYWLVTFQLLLDVFRSDIMRHVFQWDSNSGQQIPFRVVAYNVGYLIYALLVLRLGVQCVFDYDEEMRTCPETSPDFFNATTVFVSLSIAAWATIICGYLLPFCVVACLLTHNGYNPASAGPPDDAIGGMGRVGAAHAVFPAAYATTGAPPDCIDHIPVVSVASLSSADHQLECCICMEEFKREDVIVKTNCQHVFHKSCCREWLRQARTCPVCRDDVTVSHPPVEATADGGDIEIASHVHPAGSSSQPTTIPIGPTGRPVFGLIRVMQNVSNGLDTAATSSTVPTTSNNTHNGIATENNGTVDGIATETIGVAASQLAPPSSSSATIIGSLGTPSGSVVDHDVENSGTDNHNRMYAT